MATPTVYFIDDETTYTWVNNDAGAGGTQWEDWFEDANDGVSGLYGGGANQLPSTEYMPYWLHEDQSRFVNTGNATKIKTFGIVHDHQRVLYECGLYLRPMGELATTPYETWGYAPHPDASTTNIDTQVYGEYFVDYANSGTGARITAIRDAGIVYDPTLNVAPFTSTTSIRGGNSITEQSTGAFRDWAEILLWAENNLQSQDNFDGDGLHIQVNCSDLDNQSFATYNHDTGQTTGSSQWLQFRGDPTQVIAGGYETPSGGTGAGTGPTGATESRALALINSVDSARQPLNFSGGAADTTLGNSQIEINGTGAPGVGLAGGGAMLSNRGIYAFGLAIQVPTNEEAVGFRDFDMTLVFTFN